MDPNAVVEISSDEEFEWQYDSERGIPDIGDDHSWLTELLDEVNKVRYGEDDGVGDSDEVVLVGEVSPAEKSGKKSELKSSLVDLDDDCVILDTDPDKPVEVGNDNPTTGGDDDSDDLLVVSEKGQVACRDYPHPRHLCIKFPFSATPNQNHCHQCFCYVCDSLAPCIYWGNGSSSTNHCHATDKDESWRRERKKAKNGIKRLEPAAQPPFRPTPHPVQAPIPCSTRVRYPPANFGPSNITHQTRTPVKFHPLVSELLLRTNEARAQGHRHHNLATPLHGPVFKRPGSARVAPTANPYPYPPHRGNFGISNRQQNHLPQSQNYTSTANPPFSHHSNLNFQSQINPNPFLENPILHQPNLDPPISRPQVVSCQPSYPVPSHASYLILPQTQADSPSIPVSDYTQNFSWPISGTNHQSPVIEPPLAAVSGGTMAEYEYDNWIFDNQPVEPGFVDVPGPYYDSAFIETGI